MEPGVRLRRALWSAVIFLAFIGVAVAARRIVYLGPILAHRYSSPAVVPGSSLFMILGPFQFGESICARHLQWHRWNGRIFVTIGFIIGVSALLMSFTMQSIGGVNQAAATILFGFFFLFALSKAIWHVRRRQVTLHRQWMIRAFAIGLAVATIRPIVGIFFATSRFSGLTPAQFFGTAFWIGFVLHLIAAEAWIHATLPQTIKTQTTAS